MGKKRLAIAALVVLLLAGTGVAVLWRVRDRPLPRQTVESGQRPEARTDRAMAGNGWLRRWIEEATGLPPLRLTRKYGSSPTGGLTGERWRDSLGFEFVELAPGYCHIDLRVWSKRGGRWHRARVNRTRWIELPRTVWLSTRPLVTLAQHASMAEADEKLAAHAVDAPPGCEGWTLRSANADLLQFADVRGALEFSSGAIGLSRDEPGG